MSNDFFLHFLKSNPEDDKRRQDLVRILSLGLFGLSLTGLAVVATYFFINPQEWLKMDSRLALVSAVVASLMSGLVYVINKRSSLISSFGLLLLLVTISVVSDTPAQLANGRSLFLFTFPIAISSMIVAPGASFLFATLSAALVIILSRYGNVPPNMTAIVGFFLLAFISWLSSRNVMRALNEVRKTNAELDQRVIERTKELSDALVRESEQYSQRGAILNSIADGVIVFDKDWKATLANPAIKAMLGLSSELIEGKNFRDLVEHPRLHPNSRELLTGMLTHSTQPTPGFRIDWEKKTLSVSAAQVHNEGQDIGTVIVFRDVTAEVELERMKDSFVAIVSHELRTPLNAILGFAEMIGESVYGPVSDKQKRTAGRIMENAKKLLQMVSDLLDQASMQAGKMKIRSEIVQTDKLMSTVRDTMEQIAKMKGVRLFTIVDPKMPAAVIGDSQRLEQIIINLTNNAIKFSDTDDHVTITICPKEYTKWQIKVTDTGEGMPDDAKDYIFESFRQVESSQTRSHGGFGLGLSIVKQLVDLMQGEITVESKLGVGSTFIVTLPLITQAIQTK